MIKRLKSPQMIIGLSIALFFVIIAIFAPFIMPNDPLATNMQNVTAPMSHEYPLGTDDLGRCVFSRLIAGCSTTLGAALIIELVTFAIGISLGVLAGYFGRVLEVFVVGVIDILLAFPSLILALVIAGIMGPGLPNLMIAMILVYWVEYARVSRSMIMSLKEKTFVDAAIAIGSKPFAIIWRHILPNSIPSFISLLSLNMASIILGLSSMSFIGLGVQPPTPEWGAILEDSRAYMNTNPQMLIGAIICIVLSVACFQMIGEALRDSLNPRRPHLPIINKKRISHRD